MATLTRASVLILVLMEDTLRDSLSETKVNETDTS